MTSPGGLAHLAGCNRDDHTQWVLNLRRGGRTQKLGSLGTAEPHWWGLTSGLSVPGAPHVPGVLGHRRVCRHTHSCAQHTRVLTQSPRPGPRCVLFPSCTKRPWRSCSCRHSDLYKSHALYSAHLVTDTNQCRQAQILA